MSKKPCTWFSVTPEEKLEWARDHDEDTGEKFIDLSELELRDAISDEPDTEEEDAYEN